MLKSYIIGVVAGALFFAPLSVLVTVRVLGEAVQTADPVTVELWALHIDKLLKEPAMKHCTYCGRNVSKSVAENCVNTLCAAKVVYAEEPAVQPEPVLETPQKEVRTVEKQLFATGKYPQ